MALVLTASEARTGGKQADGLRDAEQLQRIALDAMAARREKLFREVFASSLSLDSGAALAGLQQDEQRSA